MIVVPKLKDPKDVFNTFLPEFKSKSYTPFVIKFGWDDRIVDFFWDYSPTRAQKRLDSYIIPGEFKRSKGSLRFGVNKSGVGYAKERGDFCLLGASYQKKNLTLFYRSVELNAGLGFDYCIIAEIEKAMGFVKTVQIMAERAFVFALKKNSGEKLHAKAKEFFDNEW